MSNAVNFNITTFRSLFPALINCSLNDTALSMFFDTAGVYINNSKGGCYCGGMSLPQLTQALYLMTAHLVAINQTIAAGSTPGVLTSATIDKISVTVEPPPAANQWQYWLQTTPYGQQLLSLLYVAGVGGLYANSAAPGRLGFRFGGVG